MRNVATPNPDECADPLVTANLYCSGHLENAIERVVLPAHTALEDLLGPSEFHLWLLRYSRRGEHLKIRIHAPAGGETGILDTLSRVAESFFTYLEPPRPDAERHVNSTAPPIDVEDAETAPAPDRSLLWTSYRRSYVCLGESPWLEDDCYVAGFTHCLGRATTWWLHQLAGQAGNWSYPWAQAVLLEAVIGILGLFELEEQRTDYLLYHRDWLLRSLLKRSGNQRGPDKMAETLARFNANVERRPSVLDGLRRRLDSRWGAGGASDAAALVLWPATTADWWRYISTRSGSAAYLFDPFAQNPVFPPAFKLLHLLANGLGVSVLNEAFSYHLLLSACADRAARDRPVRLVPSFDRCSGASLQEAVRT